MSCKIDRSLDVLLRFDSVHLPFSRRFSIECDDRMTLHVADNNIRFIFLLIDSIPIPLLEQLGR